jgi:sugar O-acyltransferase (sialic acid O-acetyltransferase NeuD family)
LAQLNITVAAIFDNDQDVESPFPDVPIYYGRDGFEKWHATLSSHEHMAFLVAIGGDRGKDRLHIQHYLMHKGLLPLIITHPTAWVADNAVVGPGSQVLAHATICVEAIVGEACIINTSASVDHECELADGVHVCPGAHIAGCVRVDRFVMIGTGASVLPRVHIGEGAILGAGAVVTRDVLPHTIVVGNPARVLRTLE